MPQRPCTGARERGQSGERRAQAVRPATTKPELELMAPTRLVRDIPNEGPGAAPSRTHTTPPEAAAETPTENGPGQGHQNATPPTTAPTRATTPTAHARPNTAPAAARRTTTPRHTANAPTKRKTPKRPRPEAPRRPNARTQPPHNQNTATARSTPADTRHRARPSKPPPHSGHGAASSARKGKRRKKEKGALRPWWCGSCRAPVRRAGAARCG